MYAYIIIIILLLLLLIMKKWFQKEHQGFTQDGMFSLKVNEDIYDDFYVSVYDNIYQPSKYLNKEMLILIKGKILILLSSILPIIPEFVETHNEHNVLINSNFNCGFYINRDVLFHI